MTRPVGPWLQVGREAQVAATEGDGGENAESVGAVGGGTAGVGDLARGLDLGASIVHPSLRPAHPRAQPRAAGRGVQAAAPARPLAPALDENRSLVASCHVD